MAKWDVLWLIDIQITSKIQFDFSFSKLIVIVNVLQLIFK